MRGAALSQFLHRNSGRRAVHPAALKLSAHLMAAFFSKVCCCYGVAQDWMVNRADRWCRVALRCTQQLQILKHMLAQ